MASRSGAARSIVGIALAGVLSLTGLGSGGPAATRAGTDLLPDLQMAAPYLLYLQTTRDGLKLLRFGTIAWNVGDGPLEVRASRRSGNTMLRVVQRITETGGDAHAYRPPGAVASFAGDGHNHWHIERFITASLGGLPGSGPDGSSQDRRFGKIGFCLMDLVRAPAELRPPNSALVKSFALSGCGDRLSRRVRMGISVGFGDDYKAYFAHQSIDVTGLARASYRLCATVNPGRLWLEKNANAANNSYWIDVDLDVAGGTVRTLRQGLGSCSATIAGVGG